MSNFININTDELDNAINMIDNRLDALENAVNTLTNGLTDILNKLHGEDEEEFSTDYPLYECKWKITNYGMNPFTAEQLEHKLNMYYEDWRNYQPNVRLYEEIASNINPGYVTAMHKIEKPMFQALSTAGCDLDTEDKWGIEVEGDVTVITT